MIMGNREGTIPFKKALAEMDLTKVARPRQIITPNEGRSVLRRSPVKTLTPQERIMELERENKLLNEEITKLRRNLLIDEMTGLGNQRKYEQDTTGIFSKYIRELDDYKKGRGKKPKGIELVVIDGNNLKKINDTLGHGLGDIAIKRLGMAISNTIRTYDFAYRKGSGADEFVIILETDKVSSKTLIDRIKHKLNEINNTQNTSTEERKLRFNVTFAEGISRIDEVVSYKLAGYNPGLIEKRLFELAEKRMYSKKREMKGV